MKFRTLWLVALLAIGVLALTGCNKNNTPVENPQENVEVVAPVENPEENVVENVEETVVENTEENVEETVVENTEEATEMWSQAETYCEENGGSIMPRQDADGNAFTLCAFENGIACEVTDFFNGDCQP